MFNVAQSFYIEKEIVAGAPSVYITSFEVYFKDKPVQGRAASGIIKPGVTANIVPFKDNVPFLDITNYRTVARVEYDQIATSATASTSTKFTLNKPFLINTDKEYAMVLSFDGNDQGFVLWKNVAGQQDVTTGNVAKISSGRVDGSYFDITNGTNITRLNDTDLKFKLNIAKFTETSKNYVVANRAYEYLVLTSGSINGYFEGGEYVYQDLAPLTGTVSVTSTTSNVTGSGTDFVTDISNNNLIVIANSTAAQVRVVNVITNTTFMNVTSQFTGSMSGATIKVFQPGTISTSSSSNTVIGTNTVFSSVSAGDTIMITDGTDGNTEARKVVSVDTGNQTLVLDVVPSFTNSTAGWFFSPVGKVSEYIDHKRSLTLLDSTANSTVLFATGKTVKGVDSLANATISTINNLSVGQFSTAFDYGIPAGTTVKLTANFANSSYQQSTGNALEVRNKINAFPVNKNATIFSRSNEVANSSGLFDGAKSFNINMQFTTDNVYTSPILEDTFADVTVKQFYINNDSTNEAYSNGAGYSKYISRPVTLDDGQVAEDLIVYMQAYKPANTDIEVYAKFLNEEDDESFTDKNWTKLILDVPTNSSIVSLDSNPNDIVSLRYVVPFYHSGTEVTSGTFSVLSATNVITSTYNTVNTDIKANSLVKVSNPIFSNNFFVDVVTSSNTTTFTVSNPVANVELYGAGLKVQTITDKNSAYLDKQDFNIIKYHNTTMSKYAGYKSFAIKIVLLASNYSSVPRVLEYRAIAVSA